MCCSAWLNGPKKLGGHKEKDKKHTRGNHPAIKVNAVGNFKLGQIYLYDMLHIHNNNTYLGRIQVHLNYFIKFVNIILKRSVCLNFNFHAALTLMAG